jgi:hypothetical protein
LSSVIGLITTVIWNLLSSGGIVTIED